MKIAYVNPAVYDYLAATLIEGLVALVGRRLDQQAV